MNYYQRYKAGEHLAVWGELLWSDLVEQQRYDDAWSVACLTMERVKYNIDTLIPRLQNLGYIFGYTWMHREEDPPFPLAQEENDTIITDIHACSEERPLRSDPLPDLQERIDVLEQSRRFMPLSLKAWYSIVGSVNFVGIPPDSWLPCLASSGDASNYAVLDPLSIDPLWDNSIQEAIQSDNIFPRLPLGNDEYGKYHQSGNQPYAIELGYQQGGDSLVRGGWIFESFVGYLRLLLSWAGLPGIGRLPLRPTRDVDMLVEGLLPF